MPKQIKHHIYTPGAMKSAVDFDSDIGWDIIGRAMTAAETELVPVVGACVEERAKTLSDMPFVVYDKRGNVVDDSDDYKNVTGAIKSPHNFLWLSGASFALTGQIYWQKVTNPAGYTKELRYMAPSTIAPDIKKDTTPDTLTFKRDGKTLTTKEVFYVWMPDAHVEFGPPQVYPMKKAEKSARSVASITEFVASYMERGMVKAFIAESETPATNDAEREEVSDYLTRMLMGFRRTIGKMRVFRKGWTFHTLGGGLEEIKNIALIKEIKYDVLEAFGVKASILWSNASNRSVAISDKLNFITSQIVPDARVIQDALNNQVFGKYEMRIEFQPRRMEEFGLVVAEKVATLQPIVSVLAPVLGGASALQHAISMTGLEVSQELLEAIAGKIEQPAPIEVTTPAQSEPAEPETPIQKALFELDKWQAKSEKAGTLVTWHAVHIPTAVVTAVKSGKSWDEAREMLQNKPSDIKTLAASINALADAMKAAK